MAVVSLNLTVPLYGFEQYLGDYYAVLTTTAGFGIMYLILWYMYKNKTFIKV